MKTLITATAVVLLLGSTACGAWWVGPTVVHAYYPPAPVYAYPAPMAAPVPYMVYSPVMPAPWYAPMVAPAPVWVGPPPVVIRGKVYIPGRPVRNVVRAVLP